jgi:hypothetical protein
MSVFDDDWGTWRLAEGVIPMTALPIRSLDAQALLLAAGIANTGLLIESGPKKYCAMLEDAIKLGLVPGAKA